jgi:hypothetical protein
VPAYCVHSCFCECGLLRLLERVLISAEIQTPEISFRTQPTTKEEEKKRGAVKEWTIRYNYELYALYEDVAIITFMIVDSGHGRVVQLD